MILAKKVRLYPTKEQEQKLWQSVGTARFIYNYTLAKQEENHRNGGKFITDGTIRKELTQLKKSELTWLNEVSNNVAKQAVKDACNSYKRFFKGLANKPKFKSRRKSKPSFYNDPIKLKVKEKKVLIEKVGWIKTSEPLPICKYYNPRITYDNKYWYISVGIDVEIKKESLTDISLGVDLGLKNFAICSNGKIYKNINKSKEVKKIEKRIKREQRKCSKKYELNKIKKEGGNRCKFIKTKNILKTEKRIQLLYRRLKNIRSNYIYQVISEMVKAKPFRIVIEDLNVSGMMKNRHLSKAIQKQCFFTFRERLKYKCEMLRIQFVLADRFFASSKICSFCGNVKKDLKLSDRTYKCEHCNNNIDRDLNASINLSRYNQ